MWWWCFFYLLINFRLFPPLVVHSLPLLRSSALLKWYVGLLQSHATRRYRIERGLEAVSSFVLLPSLVRYWSKMLAGLGLSLGAEGRADVNET